MKNCKHFKDNISAYIDNELDVNDRHEFENHIKSCADCQSEFSKILLISNSLADSKIEAPDGYMQALKAKIAQNEVAKKNIFTYVNYKTCSAVFALCLLAISFKTPLYDNLLKHRNESYYTQNEQTDTQYNDKTDDIIDITKQKTSDNTKKDNNAEKNTNINETYKNTDNTKKLQSESKQIIGDVQKEDKSTLIIPKKADDQKATDSENISIAKMVLDEQEAAANAIAESDAKEITTEESINASGGAGGSASYKIRAASGGGQSAYTEDNDSATYSTLEITNKASLTIAKNDDSVAIVEKYFGTSEIAFSELTYENYISFINEIEPYITSNNQSITNTENNVEVEIFLS